MRRRLVCGLAACAGLLFISATASAGVVDRGTTVTPPGAPPDHSYRDSSRVPIDPKTGEVGILAARTPPETPSDADVDECTSRPEAERHEGRVLNRFRWCARAMDAIRLNSGTGEARIHYTAIGYGRDDGDRSVSVFFRIDRIEAVGFRPPSPATLLTVAVECEGGDRRCAVAGGAYGKTLAEWDRDPSWRSFRVESLEAGPALGDDVDWLRWKLQFNAAGPDGSASSNLPFHRIRCDSADYFRMGGERPKACIFDDVTPFLIYKTSDPRVSEIAGHIRSALEFPDSTWPILPSKVIPGKFLGGGEGLHRISSGSTQYQQNRDEARDACFRRGAYAENGLPTPPMTGQHCDEFPFASTFEGAAANAYDFSVQAVSASHNCSAGALLGWYYTIDRILYGFDDEYYVDIRSDDPTDPNPPPADAPPGGGQEEECGVLEPPGGGGGGGPQVPVGELRIGDLALTEGDSGAQDATVTVSLSQASDGPVTVNWATADGSATAPQDYQARSGRVTFAAGQTRRQITVPVNGDTAPEPDEDFFIRLSGASGGTIADGQGRVIIRTDPEPSLSIDDVRIEEEDADVTFTARLTEPNNTPAGADFATADATARAGADYDARSGHLEIPAGATTGTIAVRVREDFADEIDEETFRLVLSDVTNVNVTDGEGTAVIRDDDRNGLFTCRATAVRLGSGEYKVANQAEHPCRDAGQPSGLLDLSVGGIGVSLRAAASTDQTPDDLTGTKPAVGDRAASHAEATDITIRAGLNLVRVEAFVADAAAECTSPPDAPRLTSGSRLTKLTVGGIEVPAGSDPLQVPLVVATLKLNETVRTANGVTQRALVLDQLLGPDLVLGEARAGWRGTDVHPDGHPCVV